MPLLSDYEGLDHYERLNVLKTATLEEINSAFRRKALALHPDKIRQHGGSDKDIFVATEVFKAFQESHEVLSDANKRAAYDESREKRTDTNELMSPDGLERPSQQWRYYRQEHAKYYEEHPLLPLAKKDIEALRCKTNPLESAYFSSLSYQNYYTLILTDAEGNEVDEHFSNVFALIEEKARRFEASPDAIPFINEPLTPKVAYALLERFLKGHYYGQTLTTIQDYLQKQIDKSENTISKPLFVAVLQFISIKNLKTEYQAALDAIHELYTAAFKASEIHGYSITLITNLKLRLSVDYEKALADVNSATERLDTIERQYNEASRLADTYQDRIRELNLRIQQQKEKLSTQALTDHLEDELELLENDRYTAVRPLENALEQCKQFVQLREEAYQTVVRLKAILAPLQKEMDEIEQQLAALAVKKNQPAFLNVLNSNYFKLTLATLISHYWQDDQPIVNQATLLSMTLKFRSEESKQYNVIEQILYHADQRLKEVASDEPNLERYYEYADFFIDLAETSPGIIRLQALISAGLCFQLAARMHDAEHAHLQMAAETMALRAYQLALAAATKLPPSLSVYATTHVTKLLSEFQFDKSTRSYEEQKKLVAQYHGYYSKVTPSHLELFSIYTGTPLQSMEGAIERTFYLISSFPSYSHLTHFVDQWKRQCFYVGYMNGLIDKFSETIETLEASEKIQPRAALAEPYYYRYEQALLARKVSRQELATLRMESMIALLDLSRTSLSELDQFMNAPHISIPQDHDGWWLPGPLNYPLDSEALDLVFYKSFDGYYINEKTGEIHLLLTRWMPGDPEEEKAFTHDDLMELIKGGVGKAVFSLDPNSAFRKYDPLQVVRFSPAGLKGTEYLRRMFGADYILKALFQRVQIQGKPPYDSKPIDSLLAGIDESVKQEILPADEINADAAQQATRCWIQIRNAPRWETALGYRVYVLFDEPEVMVKEQLLTIDANGNLVDAPVNIADDSREAKFARAFTKHYATLAKSLPVLKLEQFYKITACIQELQDRRARNSERLEVLKARLPDEQHWETMAAQKKQEWTDNLNAQAYWDKQFEEQMAWFKGLLNNPHHWERRIEDEINLLEKTRDALARGEGEDYEILAHDLLTRSQKLMESRYRSFPELTWTLIHPDFKAYVESVRKEKLAIFLKANQALPKDIAERQFNEEFNEVDECGTAEDRILHGVRQAIRERLKQRCSALQEELGEQAYLQACQQFMQGQIHAIASGQAEHEVAKKLSAGEMPEFFERYKAQLLLTMKQECEKQRVTDGPAVTIFSPGNSAATSFPVQKVSYTINCPEFNAFYMGVRNIARQSFIQMGCGLTPAQIESQLDQNFAKISQLNGFNQLAAQMRKVKKAEWTEAFLSQSDAILAFFKGDKSALEEAVSLMLDGQVERIAEARTYAIMQELKDTLRTNDLDNNPHAQEAHAQLLAEELPAQCSAIQEEFQNIQTLAKEKQVCPDFSHLKRYFAAKAFNKAIDELMQGNWQALAMATTESTIKKDKQKFAADLYPIAKATIDKQRADFETTMDTKAKQTVVSMRDELMHRMEAYVANYIEGEKRSYRNEIKQIQRLEAQFLKLGLGHPEKPDSAPNTQYRVPAIFSQKELFSVYGGIDAFPTCRAVKELDAACNALQSSSGFTRDLAIARAKEAERNAGIGAPFNLDVQISRNRLSREIMWAEFQKSMDEMRERQRSLFTPPVFEFYSDLKQRSVLDLQYSRTSDPLQPLWLWRATSQLEAQRNIPIVPPVRILAHTMPQPVQTPSVIPSTAAWVAAATRHTVPQTNPETQPEVLRSNSSNTFMNYGRAVMNGVRQWGSDLLGFARAAVETVVDTVVVAAPHPIGEFATHEEKSEWRAEPFRQRAEQRIGERVGDFASAAVSVGRLATDAAILSSQRHPMGDFATSIEKEQWREGLSHLPMHQQASRRMDARVERVEQGVQSFLEKDGPERVESIVRWSLHLLDPVMANKLVGTATRMKMPSQSGKGIERGYDPRTEHGPIINAVQRDGRWTCETPPVRTIQHAPGELTPASQPASAAAQVQQVRQEPRRQATAHPHDNIVPISAPTHSISQAPIFDPTPMAPVINPMQPQWSVFDPTPVVPVIEPAGAPAVQILGTLPPFQPLLARQPFDALIPGIHLPMRPVSTPKKNNVNAISNCYLDVVLDPAIAKAEGRYILPQVCITQERYHTTQGQAVLQTLKSAELQSFYETQHAITEKRREQYANDISKIEKEAWAKFNLIVRDFSREEKNRNKQLFLEVLRYRENIETALYARELEYVNCGEQTATAFVDELIRVKNEQPNSRRPTKLHLISLRSRKEDHAFLVSGSTTLAEASVNNAAAVADILRTMDGTVIDYWNNPAAGGVRLRAEMAREQFVMYGPEVVEVMDQIFVEEYFTEEIHARIQTMPISQALKKLLTECAGPSLDELQALFSHSNKSNRQQTSMPNAAQASAGTVVGTARPNLGNVDTQPLLDNSPLFHNVFADTGAPLFSSLPAFKVVTMDEIKECQARAHFLYVVTAEGELRMAPYLLEKELWTGRNRLKHDELAYGKPVYAAGEVFVEAGEIKEINNKTGHYLVFGEHLAPLVEDSFNQAGGNARGKFKYIDRVAEGLNPIVTYPGSRQSTASADAANANPGANRFSLFHKEKLDSSAAPIASAGSPIKTMRPGNGNSED